MSKHHSSTIRTVAAIMLIISLPTWSCKKFVTLPLPSTSIPAENIFIDATTLTGALNGVYNSIAGNSLSSTGFTLPSLLSDEFYSQSVSGNDYAAQTNTYTADVDFILFRSYYVPIYQANYILAGIDAANNVPVATRNQIKGECLFLRAISYFHLVNYYGAVPLYTTADVNTNALLPKSPVADVYKQIVTDLTDAAALMDENYVIPVYSTPPTPIPVRTRANRHSANALLARVYLYTKDYAKAISMATTVISSPLYTLNSDLNSIFISTSPEVIFQYWNRNGFALAGSGYVPSNPANAFFYTVRPELANAFEAGDNRKAAFLQAGTGAQATNYYVYKWKAKSAVPGKLEYLIPLRLAEMFLIRAEAYAQSNKIPEGVDDVFTIRKRAGLVTPLTITTQSALLDMVASERRKELCFENGHRWFDLIRTEKALPVLGPLKPGLDSHYLVLPIPRSTIGLNPNLEQNKGYN